MITYKAAKKMTDAQVADKLEKFTKAQPFLKKALKPLLIAGCCVFGAGVLTMAVLPAVSAACCVAASALLVAAAAVDVVKDDRERQISILKFVRISRRMDSERASAAPPSPAFLKLKAAWLSMKKAVPVAAPAATNSSPRKPQP